MKLTIKVLPKSSREKVEQQADGSYKVFVHAPPTDGQANKAVIEVLAKHFDVAKRCVKIVSGEKRRNKVVDIALPMPPSANKYIP